MRRGSIRKRVAVVSGHSQIRALMWLCGSVSLQVARLSRKLGKTSLSIFLSFPVTLCVIHGKGLSDKPRGRIFHILSLRARTVCVSYHELERRGPSPRSGSVRCLSTNLYHRSIHRFYVFRQGCVIFISRWFTMI